MSVNNLKIDNEALKLNLDLHLLGNEKLINNEEIFINYDNNYLLILMLMRILLYSKNIKDEKFLYNNIVSLWNDQKH